MMRKLLILLALGLSAWAEPPDLSVQVDLNSADISQPLRPRHEVAFQLAARPPGTGGAPGGLLEVYRLTNGGPKLVDSITCRAQPADAPATVKATGYLYRQLFVWSGWRKAGAGRYRALYRGKPQLKVDFQLP